MIKNKALIFLTILLFIGLTIIFLNVNFNRQTKNHLIPLKEQQFTKTEIENISYNALTDLAVINSSIIDFYNKLPSQDYLEINNSDILIENIVIWRHLIEILNDYIFIKYQNDKNTYYNQQNLLLEILQNEQHEDILVALLQKLLHKKNKVAQQTLIKGYLDKLNYHNSNITQKLFFIKINQILTPKLENDFLHEINYQVLNKHYNQIIYLALENKFQKNLDTEKIKSLLKLLDASLYPAAKKISIISEFLENAVLQGHKDQIKIILDHLNKYYIEIDQNDNISSYQSYLNLAYALKSYQDSDLYVSYFLDAAELSNKYSFLSYNYFRLKLLNLLLENYIQHYDFLGAKQIINNFESIFKENLNYKFQLYFYFMRNKTILLNAISNYKEALANAVQIYQEAKSLYPDNHPLLIDLLYHLTSLYSLNNNHEQALELFPKLNNLALEYYGFYSNYYLQITYNYSSFLVQNQKYDLAFKYYKKARKISKKLYGKKSSIYQEIEKKLQKLKTEK